MKHLKIAFTALILSLLLVACGQQSARTSTPVNVDMSVRTEPEQLAVGETTLIVTLKDANASPIDGAALRVHADMDHEGMTPLDGEASESTNGEYRVPLQWTMGGGWIVTITARLPENKGEVTETFDFFVEAVSSESIVNRPIGMDTETTGETEIDIIYQPDNDPTIVGAAAVTVTVRDAEGNPLNNAVVEIVGDMAHPGMTPVSGQGEHTENGQYVVPLRWTMAGDWQVTVKVTLADGRQFEQIFNQQVVRQ